MSGKKISQKNVFVKNYFWCNKIFGPKNIRSAKILHPENFRLYMSELTNPILTWLVITWFDLPKLDLTCPNFIWLDPNGLDLIYRITIRTSHEYPPDTFQTRHPSRQQLETCQTPSRQFPTEVEWLNYTLWYWYISISVVR